MNPSGLPPAVAMLQMIAGRWVSAAISVAAMLNVADTLADGPKAIDSIAGSVGAHAPSLHRLLRALASVGVFAEDEQSRFANTPLSEVLRSGPGTMRAMAVMMGQKPLAHAWDELLHAVKTGESAFEKVNGATLFDYFAKDAQFARVFNDAMTARSAMEARAVTEAYDFSRVKTLVDVAGGHGLLLSTVLAKTPSQRGLLFDMPIVVAGAGPSRHARRPGAYSPRVGDSSACRRLRARPRHPHGVACIGARSEPNVKEPGGTKRCDLRPNRQS